MARANAIGFIGRLVLGVCLVTVLAAGTAAARISIDITNPRQQVLIALPALGGLWGKEVSEVVADDLEFTGFFVPLPRDAFIEGPDDPFDTANWAPLGAELVLKGRVRRSGNTLSVSVKLHDAQSGRVVFRKLYRARPKLLRPLAHSIANDIYNKITGRKGVFRSKIAFVSRKDGRDELHIMDYDGKRPKSLGVKADSIMAPHWAEDAGRLIYSAASRRRWVIRELNIKTRKEKAIYWGRGTNIVGDFFPGSREFAFSSSKEGTPDIFTYHMGTKRLLRLTSKKGIEVSPAVSPDGRKLAFVSDSGGSPQIYTTDKIGYNTSRITYSGSYNTSPVWSPKGDRLAYSGRYMGKNQIFTVKPDGSGLLMLTDSGNNESPSFSPDGRYIAFTSDRGGRKGVYIMRANGEAQKRITPWTVSATGSRWSPQ